MHNTDQIASVDLDGLMVEHRSLPLFVGATSTTLRSVGLILALVAILTLGKTVCFRSAVLTEGVVQRPSLFDQASITYGSVVSRSQENLHRDSAVELSDSDEESGALDQLFHDLFPSPGDNTALLPTLNHNPSHDVHLTGSQFDLDGAPNVRSIAFLSFDACTSVASPGHSADADLESSQLDDVREAVDSYNNLDFDFTVNEIRDEDSISVASMAVLVDQNESHGFHWVNPSVVS
ncbi:hypothetical protein PG984_012951 [Apiospora sp. TS-2023a]